MVPTDAINTPLISLRHELRHALDGLELHIAGKAVADSNITRTERHHAALYVADKVQTALVARLFQQRVSLLAERITLGILRAVVDKADARLDDTVYLLRIQRSEERELEQHFGGAFGVRARIAQHDLTVRAAA